MKLSDSKTSFIRLLSSPLIVALTVTLLLFIVGHPHYETNDDMGMISLLSGKLGLEARPDGIFLSLPLSRLFYSLYGFADSVPWYGITLYSFLFTGFYLGLKTVSLANLQPVNRAFVSLGLVFFYMSLFYIFNFTSVALFMWFMAMAYLACLNLNTVRPRRVEILIGIFLGAAYLVRPSLAYLPILFSLPALFTFLMPATKKRVLYVATPFLMAVLLSLCMEYAVHSDRQYQEYKRFNRIRSEFTDTQKSTFTRRTPEALRLAGWSVEDYILAKEALWFHDETIYGTEKLKTFLDANTGSELSIVSAGRLRQSFTENMIFILVLFLCCAASLLNGPFSYSIPQNREPLMRNLFRATLIASLAGAVVLAGIRFPHRVALPIICFFILLSVLFRPFLYKGGINTGQWNRYFYILVFSLLIFFMYSHYRDIENFHSRKMVLKKYTEKSFHTVQDINGPDTVFIYGSVNNYLALELVNPLREYLDVMQVTLFPMGWLIYSPAYHSFLSKHGFGDRERAVPAMVDNGKAVFCFFQEEGNQYDDYTACFLRHLEQHYAPKIPGKSLKVAMMLDMRMKDAKEKYNGWVFFKIVTIPNALAGKEQKEVMKNQPM